jgi:hypothetical protein
MRLGVVIFTQEKCTNIKCTHVPTEQDLKLESQLNLSIFNTKKLQHLFCPTGSRT